MHSRSERNEPEDHGRHRLLAGRAVHRRALGSAAAPTCSSPRAARSALRVDGAPCGPVAGAPSLDDVQASDLVMQILGPELARAAAHENGGRLLVLLATTRPGFRGNAFHQQGGFAMALRVIPFQHPDVRGAAPAGRDRALRPPPAGPRARHRPDRLREVDDARVDDRLHQRAPAVPHPHDRGPDRVRARTQARGGQPARGRRRHRLVRARARGRRCARTPTSSSSVRCATPRRSSSR